MVCLSKRRKGLVKVLVADESPEVVAEDCLGAVSDLKIVTLWRDWDHF